VFASGIPVAYIVRGIRRGRYTDHHVSVREHRSTVIIAAAVSVVVGLTLMLVLDAPGDLVALVVAMLAGLALTFAVTKWWGKVSFHTAVAAGTATTLVLVFGPWLYLAWPFVGAIAWSRVQLKEHTVAQTVVGAALGALAAGVVFPLVR
jgi:membrane-associated phospholipid phosphatase